jgi:rRNA-processing protein CGR1
MATAAPSAKAAPGMRKNGKQWHAPKTAFRPAATSTQLKTSGDKAYAKRALKQAQLAETKKLEREMKAEKEEERQRRIQAIKDKRAAKEEKERYAEMAEKMHARRVERLRRREKRNKMLKS